MIWKIFCTLLCATVLALAPKTLAQQNAPPSERYCDANVCHALLIAIDNYEYGDQFNTSIPGMQRVAQSLSDIGFENTELLDASREDMFLALESFSQRDDIDVSIILFIGNGVAIDGIDYIMPSDVAFESGQQDRQRARASIKASSLPTQALLEFQPGTDLNITIVDSGRDELFGNDSKGFVVRDTDDILETLDRENASDRDVESMLLYSSAPGQVAYDEAIFADGLAEALKANGDIVRVLASVADEMAVETDLYQYPELEVYGVRGRPICLVSCETSGFGARANFARQLQQLERGTCEGDYSSAESREERYALVIGNNGYSETDSWGRLQEPVNDADTVGDALKQTDFIVRKCHNLPIARMRTEIEAFQSFYKNRVENAAAEVTPAAFFYFSGHGAADEETNYMIPTDSIADESGELTDDAISIDQFTSRFPDAGAQIMVVIDACRNALKNSDDKSGHKGLQPFVARPNMIIASATMPGELAKQDSGYARFLAERITKQVENVYESEVEFVFRDVGDQVEVATRGEQRPDTTGTFSGRFFFQTTP